MLRFWLLCVSSLSVLSGCSRSDCQWETDTLPFSMENLKSGQLPGVYQISVGSTENTFSEEVLAESRLYIISDSSSSRFNSGELYFKGFPYWDNAQGKNLLGSFIGRWVVQLDKGNIFSENLYVFAPQLRRGEFESAKSIIMRHDLRMKDENTPLLIVTVLKNYSNDSSLGHTFVYNSTKSKDACNYLVFEKVSNLDSSEFPRLEFEMDSLKTVLNPSSF